MAEHEHNLDTMGGYRPDGHTWIWPFSLVSPDGDWCSGNDCPCHIMPTGEVGTR